MTPEVGDVIEFDTALLDGDIGPKLHICVDAERGFYLVICSYGLKGDLPITHTDCDLLSYASHISFRDMKVITEIPAEHIGPVRLSDDFLRHLVDHIDGAGFISPINKAKMTHGIRTYLENR